MSLHPLASPAAAPLLWLIPTGLFLASGLSKILAPVGTAPLLVSGVVDRIPYSTMLRSLGFAEVCLAVLVFVPRHRRVALFGIMGALAAFSLFVALNAADQRLIGNCGCFGVLDPTRGHSTQYFGWLILRNAVIGLLAVIGALIHGKGVAGRRWPSGTLMAGDATSSDAALQAGDHVFFVGANCGHCRSLGPDLQRYDQSLRAIGCRVVLVVTDKPQVPIGFLKEIGCEDVVAFASSDRNAILRLGVTGVPKLLVLGSERQVIYNEAFPTPATFWKSVELGNKRIPEFSRLISDAVVRGMFGDSARCTDPLVLMSGVYQSEIIGTAEEGLRLYVVVEGARLGDTLELAIGVDSDGRIRRGIPLDVGASFRVMDSVVPMVDYLVGMSVTDAMTTADNGANCRRYKENSGCGAPLDWRWRE